MNANPIQSRNDVFRNNLPHSITSQNVLLITQGVQSQFNSKQVADILSAVTQYDTFNEGNDPYGEHDFGSFAYSGRQFLWKIDYYGGQENLDIVLTVMLAEEY